MLFTDGLSQSASIITLNSVTATYIDSSIAGNLLEVTHLQCPYVSCDASSEHDSTEMSKQSLNDFP